MLTKLWVGRWGEALFKRVYGKCRVHRYLLVMLAGVYGVCKGVVSMERDEAAKSVSPPHRRDVWWLRWCQAERFELFPIQGRSWEFAEDF